MSRFDCFLLRQDNEIQKLKEIMKDKIRWIMLGLLFFHLLNVIFKYILQELCHSLSCRIEILAICRHSESLVWIYLVFLFCLFIFFFFFDDIFQLFHHFFYLFVSFLLYFYTPSNSLRHIHYNYFILLSISWIIWAILKRQKKVSRKKYFPKKRSDSK